VRSATLLLALAVVSTLAAPLPPVSPLKRDRRAIQGEWVCDHSVHSGFLYKPDDIGASVRGGRIAFTTRGEVFSTWAFSLDPGQGPGRLDLRQEAAPTEFRSLLRSGGTLIGVYRVDRDWLALSVIGKGGVRPSDLKGHKDGEELWVFTRKR
jgi:uncharacterized protein (TIGR03067 family)